MSRYFYTFALLCVWAILTAPVYAQFQLSDHSGYQGTPAYGNPAAGTSTFSPNAPTPQNQSYPAVANPTPYYAYPATSAPPIQQPYPQPIQQPTPQNPAYSVPQQQPPIQQFPVQQQPVVMDATAYPVAANPANHAFAVPIDNTNANFNANVNTNAEINAINIPVFDVPQFQTPDVSAVSSAPIGANGLPSDTPFLAFHSPVGNAFGTINKNSETVPAFQSANSIGASVPESRPGLLFSSQERPTDRAAADRENYERWRIIKETKNTNAWMEPLPSYSGPLDFRTVGRPDDRTPLENLLVSFHEEGAKQDEYAYDWETEEKHYFDFSMLDPTRVGKQMKRWVGLSLSEEKAKKNFQDGLDAMKAEKYMKAADLFEWAAYYAPKTILEEDSRYHAAECYYRVGRNYDASQQYKRIILDFPSSQYKSEIIKNLYEIAKTWIKQTEGKSGYVNITDKSRPRFDTFGHAKGALETIYINVPRDPLADDAVYLLAVSYMRRATKVQGDVNYEHAAECFKQLRDFYPNSEYIVDAMRWEAICHKYASLGADYDAAQINQAGEIADQLLLQHAVRLDANAQEEILKVRNEVTENKAEKLWLTGQFYDVRKEYRAARLQYELLLEKYPATKHAEKARKRIEEIRDFPPEPVSPLAKIKGIFVK
ncbi:MAG: hypothetical protein LBT05_15250 [Planctomycetaceae bacterium]|jgi:outer membrane protein assembly factor BamD (BamD/ComL family)|nr:hypothetical protein [Planctomycetaceae bacterium]